MIQFGVHSLYRHMLYRHTELTYTGGYSVHPQVTVDDTSKIHTGGALSSGSALLSSCARPNLATSQ